MSYDSRPICALSASNGVVFGRYSSVSALAGLIVGKSRISRK